ncbi:6-bladed beta-propeller [Belliella kenyensis]|nr:6-bladed beta-propeller [Belliella kenyensis]
MSKEITLNYSDIFEDLEIVALDNSEGVLVAEINDLLITNDRIIILDNRLSESVHFFDIKGKFINSIRADDGPQVFTYPGNFELVNNEEELMVKDSKSFNTYYYDLSGNFIRQVYTTGFGVSSLVNIDSEIYAVSTYQDSWNKKVEIRNSQELSLSRFVNIEDELEFKLINGQGSSIFGNSHNSFLYYIQCFHPKIIEIKNGEIISSYFFEFSSSNFEYENGETYQMMDVYQTIKMKNLNALTGNLVAMEHYIFADFTYGGDQYLRTFLFDTKSNQSFVLEGMINDMDIVMRNRRSLYKYPVRNKRLAYAYHPSDITYALGIFEGKTSNEHTKRIQALDLKNDNNPVLFIYTLKEKLQLNLD